MSDEVAPTFYGEWRATRVWAKHHERIPDRWEWLIEDDRGTLAIVPENILADGADEAEAIGALIAKAPAILAENERRLAWQAEALAVLRQWEEVHTALGEPARLGESKPVASKNEVLRLRAERLRLQAGVERLWSKGVLVPGEMTPEKLRIIADWLDTYDVIVERVIFTMNGDEVLTGEQLNAVRGRGVQEALRRWADEIEEADRES